MASTFKTIEITRGAGASGTLTVKVNGVAVNVTGYTGRLVGKAKKTDADATAAINVALAVSEALAGVMAWSLTAAQTKAVAPGSYEGEFHIVPPTGEPIKAQGLIDCTREVYNG
jgi:hypothetical protein